MTKKESSRYSKLTNVLIKGGNKELTIILELLSVVEIIQLHVSSTITIGNQKIAYIWFNNPAI